MVRMVVDRPTTEQRQRIRAVRRLGRKGRAEWARCAFAIYYSGIAGLPILTDQARPTQREGRQARSPSTARRQRALAHSRGWGCPILQPRRAARPLLGRCAEDARADLVERQLYMPTPSASSPSPRLPCAQVPARRRSIPAPAVVGPSLNTTTERPGPHPTFVERTSSDERIAAESRFAGHFVAAHLVWALPATPSKTSRR